MVEQSGWDLKKMREEPHEWVDILTDNCIDVSAVCYTLLSYIVT